MSTSGDVSCSTSEFSIEMKGFYMLLPHMYHDIPPMY